MENVPIYKILHRTYLYHIFENLNLVHIKRFLRINKDFLRLRTDPSISKLCLKKIEVREIKTDEFLKKRLENAFDTQEKTLQHLMVIGDIEIVDELMRKRRLLNKVNDYTILYECIRYRSFDILKFFIEEDFQLDLTVEYNFLFMQVSRVGNVELVVLLLNDARLRHVKDDEAAMNKAFSGACLENNALVCEYFIQNAFIKNGLVLNECLVSSCMFDCKDVVKLLLEDGRANPTYRGSVCLRGASKKGKVDIVRLLLVDGRANPDVFLSDCVQNACSGDYLKVADIFLDDGRIDPSIFDNYLLCQACFGKHLNLFKRLLKDKRVDPTVNNNICIRTAKERGLSGTVRMLIADERVLKSLSEKDVSIYRRM